MTQHARTLGELRASGWRGGTVKDELRRNLTQRLRDGLQLFPGIVGFELTVIPQIQNAILARHDFILLGLRGQAKTRVLRALKDLLDERIPAVLGCQIHDDPLAPVCRACRRRLAESGDALEIEWLGRDERYREKLATPDVTMADLIGDIDPIKAATEKRFYSDEEIIHFGIVPRTNRGIFAINELPDLSPRIQVGLLNILEERDLQIRGFPVRIPLDILLVFSANPEDYTNRGNIITPLKDRLDSQILTHYPASIEAGMQITAQEAWVERGGTRLRLPALMREVVEEVAVQARKSEFVDQASGVSARMAISALEALASNMERRALVTGDNEAWPRMCDLDAMVPALSGKIELVYEGEQEGVLAVARKIVRQAVAAVFARKYPDAVKSPAIPGGAGGRKSQSKQVKTPETASPYQPVLDWFGGGNTVELADGLPQREYVARLERVPRLRDLAAAHAAACAAGPSGIGPAQPSGAPSGPSGPGAAHPTGAPTAPGATGAARPRGGPAGPSGAGPAAAHAIEPAEVALHMEFLLEGLHQNSLLAKVDLDSGTSYRDMLKEMFEQMVQTTED